MYILLENIVRENVVYPITFVVKFFLMLHDIWNEVMKHKLPCRSALVLQKSWLWPKILGNRLGVLTSVFIAIDYFFRCHKSTFNLKNHKCIFKDFFCYYASTYTGIIFPDMYISGIYINLWKALQKFNLYQS